LVDEVTKGRRKILLLTNCAMVFRRYCAAKRKSPVKIKQHEISGKRKSACQNKGSYSTRNTLH